jgi:hypothetical protein
MPVTFSMTNGHCKIRIQTEEMQFKSGWAQLRARPAGLLEPDLPPLCLESPGQMLD